VQRAINCSSCCWAVGAHSASLQVEYMWSRTYSASYLSSDLLGK